MRAAFYALTQSVFGFSLEPWQRAGCWSDVYTCHSLMSGDLMVANASTTRQTLLVGGRQVPAVQVGTVATLPHYRNRGLSRVLMERILAKHAGEAMFLFANDSVVDFYPRFGFRRKDPAEMQPIWSDGGQAAQPGESLQKIAPTDSRIPVLVAAHAVRSPVFDVERDSIALFHVLQVYPEHVHYAPGLDALIIAERNGVVLDVYDILAARAPAPERLLVQLCRDGVREIRYHFMPDGFGLPFRMIPYRPRDTHFFVNEAFPVIGAPFIFPVTART